MINEVVVEEVKKVVVEKSPHGERFDKIKLDENLILILGKKGVVDLLTTLMHEFRLEYKDDELVEILQDPDFNSVREILVEAEVKDLDETIIELRKDLKESEGNYDIAMGLVKSYQEGH